MITQCTDDALLKDIETTIPHVTVKRDEYHFTPKSTSDRIARTLVHTSARTADLLFKKRYGNRAVVLETIAAVPGMVGGFFQHLKSLRLIRDDRGWIKTLIDEAENERMHLLVYSEINKPTSIERLLIMIVQFIFCIIYFLLYLISPRTAHRTIGYFEEEAIHSYHVYLGLIDNGTIKNVPAPEIARVYWHLKDDAMLRDVVLATIDDEIIHRDVNHAFANDKIGTNLWG